MKIEFNRYCERMQSLSLKNSTSALKIITETNVFRVWGNKSTNVALYSTIENLLRH